MKHAVAALLVLAGAACAKHDDAAGADAQAGHSVVLQWEASATPGVTYRVYRATSPGGPYVLLRSGVVDTTTVDDRVENGASYFYVVRSSDDAGESASSNEARAVVP